VHCATNVHFNSLTDCELISAVCFFSLRFCGRTIHRNKSLWKINGMLHFRNMMVQLLTIYTDPNCHSIRDSLSDDIIMLRADHTICLYDWPKTDKALMLDDSWQGACQHTNFILSVICQQCASHWTKYLSEMLIIYCHRSFMPHGTYLVYLNMCVAVSLS